MKGIFKLMAVGLTSAASLLGGMGVGVYDYSDNIPASKTHPNSNEISVENVPMFIVLGFDDNGIADATSNGGATWIRNYLKEKKNPSGAGTEETFDGSDMRASFYLTAKYGRENVYEGYSNVRKVWNALYNEGHEMGNHSTIHLGYWDAVKKEFISFDGRSYTKEQWLVEEMDTCHDLLIKEYDNLDKEKGIGILESDLYGWRTPRLEWNDNTFLALKEKGYVYDCSVESESDNDGKTLYWPFTMNDGHPYEQSVGNHVGLWELPAYRFYIPTALQAKNGGKGIITGLDYNVWANKESWQPNMPEYNGPEFTEILKHTLDLRMEGNRAPMLIGLHSDIYSSKKDGDYKSTASARERQLAIEDFIDYAVNTYSDIRVVTAIDVINWMRNPVGLDKGNPIAQKKHYSTNKNFAINSATHGNISFTVPSSGEYSLKVYSLKGSLLLNTKVKAESAGKNSASWNKEAIHNGSYLFILEGKGGKASTHINLVD